MNTSRFISDQIDQDTNIIWFENSNNYIVVNDVINNLILNKLSPSTYPLNTESINILNDQSVKEEIKTLISDCNKTSNPLTFFIIPKNNKTFFSCGIFR